jgi:hypothetical protein
MSGIFISYRRDDSDIAAGRLADGLSEIFGPKSIFRDVESLELGENYERALNHALDCCAVLLAVIGPKWMTITDENGHSRLEEPQDWVRMEIAAALERQIPVIPVLISGTQMPREADLPNDLRPLLKHQACEFSDHHWKQDLELLAQALENLIHLPSLAPLRAPPVALGVVKLVGSKQRIPMISPQITILIDNREISRMKWSDDITLEIQPGHHTICGTATLNSSNTLSFDLLPGETKMFLIGGGRLTGILKIESM